MIPSQRQINRRFLLMAVTILLIVPMLPAATTCKLLANDESGLRESWPLIGGLPLPAGTIRDAANIRVVDSQGKEVPLQADPAATWQDGSLRWALLSFMGMPGETYRAEFGADVKRAEAKGIITREGPDGTLEINTGAAVFIISPKNLLVDSCKLTDHGSITLWKQVVDFFKPAGGGGIILWGSGETSAYLMDNQGRTAKCAGAAAEIKRTILKSGPLRLVVRTEGWYVTASGEKVARGIARMSFFANSTLFKISHTFVFTEDTNKLWLRDYGLEVPLRKLKPTRAVFAVAPDGADAGRLVELKPGTSACLLQDDFPHFAETNSHFSLSLVGKAKTERLVEGAVCGNWCDASSGKAGVTVAVRDMVEQFPKELEVSPAGVRVHLWPAHCGREWDFRSPTLVKEYWGKWVEKGKYNGDKPVNIDRLLKTPSNAQGSSKTHEVWLMPHAGALDIKAATVAGFGEAGPGSATPATTLKTAAQRAHAVNRPVLLQAEPAFTCASGAIPWPIYPKGGAPAEPSGLSSEVPMRLAAGTKVEATNSARPQEGEKEFPAEEALISDFFDRTVLPYRVFPMTGLIEWGSCPYLDFHKQAGQWMADFYRTSLSIDYGMRRYVWGLYARSGERKYYEYGTRFNKHCADWEMAHETFGNVRRGGFQRGVYDEPFHWRGSKVLLETDNSGHEMINWLLEYYLTGEEHARETTVEFTDTLKQCWDLKKASAGEAQMVILRILSALYTREWDPEIKKMAEDLFNKMVDLDAPNGLIKTLNRPYGPTYKAPRSALCLYDYWQATGDERAKQAFLKVVDYEYRFNAMERPTEYQSIFSFLSAVACEWTGRPEYLRLANQVVRKSLAFENKTLAEDLKDVADLNTLARLPYRGLDKNMNYFLGIPAALAVLAKTKENIPPWPLIAYCGPPTEEVYPLFEKTTGQPARMGLTAMPLDSNRVINVSVIGPGNKPAKAGVTIEEKAVRMDLKENFDSRISPHVEVTLPADAPAGVYRVKVGKTTRLIIQDATGEKAALYCPEGFWFQPRYPEYRGNMPDMPGAPMLEVFGEPFYFNVPAGLEQVKIFVTSPVTVLRSDGSIALEESETNTGDVAMSVDGKPGVWTMKTEERPGYPSFPSRIHVRFDNLLPVIASAPTNFPTMPWNPPPCAPKWQPPTNEWLEGVMGKALHLAQGRSLKFARGEALPDGSYTHFPGKEGTIEFWFRPDWSSAWFKEQPVFTNAFLTGGSVDFQYCYGFDPRRAWTRRELIACLALVANGTLGKKAGAVGTQSRYFFPSGEWVHLAAVWRYAVDQNKATTNFAVYINGSLQPPSRSYPYLDQSGKTNFVLNAAEPYIKLGAGLDGSIDELRVSKVARYNGDFTPPNQPFKPDADTLALFHFDGNTKGISGTEGKVFEME
jgi:hypothetical protein